MDEILPFSIVNAVRHEKFDDMLRDYLAVLGERHPFSIEMTVDAQPLLPRLAEVWPEDTEWSAQAYDLWERIDQIVSAVSNNPEVPEIFLQLSAAASPLVPRSVPAPDKPAMLATFDSVAGVLRQYTLAAQEGPLPSLEALAIPAGLMVVCQSLSPAASVQEIPADERASGLGAGESIYSERGRDKTIPPRHEAPGEKVQDKPAEETPGAPPPVIAPPQPG